MLSEGLQVIQIFGWFLKVVALDRPMVFAVVVA